MGGVRTDVSFTLFLSAPESYDGGELVIDSAAGEDAFKLGPGSVLTYPSTTLHRVAPVTRGQRLAAVGWVRSYIRDPAHRDGDVLGGGDDHGRFSYGRGGESRRSAKIYAVRLSTC
jgi:PKHD-type hydroxylase